MASPKNPVKLQDIGFDNKQAREFVNGVRLNWYAMKLEKATKRSVVCINTNPVNLKRQTSLNWDLHMLEESWHMTLFSIAIGGSTAL